jgi:predicted transposase YdaD
VAIESVVLLLRPEAEGPGFTGRLHYRAPGSEVNFSYHLVRVWELPVETLLTGALATLPLAPIADVRTSELPGVIARMKARVMAEAQVGDSVELWTTVALLMGLRYKPDAIRELLRGVSGLEESTIYQEILGKGQEIGRVEGREEGREEGRAEEARALLLRMGNKRFGAPSDQVKAVLETIASLARLEALADRLLEVETWQEFLR